jgi:MFS family permease
MPARPSRLAPSALIAAMFMGSTLLTPLYALYAERFGFSQIVLTLVYAAYVLGNLAALLLFGRVSDHIGRRRTAWPAIIVAVVGTLAFLFAQSVAWLFVGRAVSGLAIGIATAAGTAWLAELEPPEYRARAALVATTANFTGIAAGPIVAGLLAQYAPAPLRLSYIAYLVVLAVTAAIVLHTPEPAIERDGRFSVSPRIGVAGSIRTAFVPPAVTAFCTFAFIGFYAALAPSLMAHKLHQTNHALGGAVVGELFIVAALTNFAARRVSSRTAMLAGLAVQLPALALLVAADALASLPLLLVATAVGGISAALGYRGSLEVVNAIAPEDRRAETVAAYMLVCFVGNSLPVIGVALLAAASGSNDIALDIFAGTVAGLAVVAFLFGRRHDRAAA